MCILECSLTELISISLISHTSFKLQSNFFFHVISPTSILHPLQILKVTSNMHKSAMNVNLLVLQQYD